MRHNCTIFLALLSLAGLNFTSADETTGTKKRTEKGAETDFQPIFNGEDLAGWEGNMKLWKVREGMIVGDSAGIRHNDFLATKKTYQDFELRLEFKLHGGRGNSGVQFRTRRVPDGTEVEGYQADIGENYWGCLYDEHRRRKVLAPASPELKTVLKKDGWNEYVIRARGNHVLLKINGLTTVDYREADSKIARKGVIALQVHSGPPMRIDFRNLRIRELKHRN